MPEMNPDSYRLAESLPSKHPNIDKRSSNPWPQSANCCSATIQASRRERGFGRVVPKMKELCSSQSRVCGDMPSPCQLTQPSVFFFAVKKNDSTAVKHFLNAGTDKDIRDQSKRTGLIMAAQNGHEDIVRVLIDAGADTSARDKSQATGLWWAANRGHSDIVLSLIDAGADNDARDYLQTTALITAAVKGHANVVHVLLASGADKDAVDESNATGLIVAAMQGHDKVVRLLLDAGADKNAKDKVSVIGCQPRRPTTTLRPDSRHMQ